MSQFLEIEDAIKELEPFSEMQEMISEVVSRLDRLQNLTPVQTERRSETRSSLVKSSYCLGALGVTVALKK